MTHQILYFLLIMNVLAFIFYGWDKFCAKRRMRRVPERTLHMLTLLGGSFGALAGQKIFRHKTRKGSFQLWFRLTLAVQVLLVLVLLTLPYL